MFGKKHKSKERNKHDEKLLETVLSGDAMKLRQLVEKQKYSSLLSPDQHGRLLVFEAIQRGFKEMVEILVEADEAQLRAKNHDGMLPVHAASRAGYHEIVTYLLKKKSAVDPVDKKGQTPLHYAAISGSKDSLQALIAHQADTEKKDINGNTALLLACQAGQKSTAIALMNASSNINSHNRQQKTPLMLACERGLTDVVRLLLQRGAQTNLRDTAGKTARYYAETVGHTDCATLLPADEAKEASAINHEIPSTPIMRKESVSRKAKNEIEGLKKKLEEEKKNHSATKAELDKLRQHMDSMKTDVEESDAFGEGDVDGSPVSQEEEIKILKKRIGSVVLEKKQLEEKLEKQAKADEEVKKLKRRVTELELEVEEKHDGIAMVPAVVIEQFKASSEAKIAVLEEKLKRSGGNNEDVETNDSLVEVYRGLLVQAVKGTLPEDVKEKILSM
eukprot:m.76292 g.76292  ORF g.76292 m.76292 type:complete len:447 (-) comp11874_c0_seq1:178-1518(-)